MNMELEKVSCGLCDCLEYTVRLQARDYRFGHPHPYQVVECRECGLLYTNPRPNKSAMVELYEKYYSPVEDLVANYQPATSGIKGGVGRLWHRWTGYCRERIPAKGRFLDVGCGYGHALSFFAARGLEVYGIELNPKAAEACRQRGLSVCCGSLEDAALPAAAFDTILLHQVIKHLPAPLATLKELHRLLAPGGTIHIFCPNANSYLMRPFSQYWHGWHLPFHFYHFTGDTLRLLAEKSHFTFWPLRTITPVNCLTVSLKSYLYSRESEDTPTLNRGRIFDSIPARAILSLPLRILDNLLPSRGDCLWAVLRKD
jgi:SAM-dependent methyltransferase